MERHCENAMAIANFLSESKEVEHVIYPFLPSGPQYQLAKEQMKLGGGLVAFDIKGGKGAAFKFLDNLELYSLTANLGDSRSIATHPSSTTHSKLSKEEQKAAGINSGFIRLSIGLEHVNELIADLDQALAAVA